MNQAKEKNRIKTKKYYHAKRAVALGMQIEEYEGQLLQKEKERAKRVTLELEAADKMKDEILERSVQGRIEKIQLEASRNRLKNTEDTLLKYVLWFNDNPVSHPDWDKKVSELHAIEQRIRVITNPGAPNSQCGGITEYNTINLNR